MLTKIILIRNPCDRELRLIEIILFDEAKTRSRLYNLEYPRCSSNFSLPVYIKYILENI